ncbi:MAG TPA: hypothetical protein VGM90_00015 [Kofleriaceae bacterium]|jgi:hypothetical protein
MVRFVALGLLAALASCAAADDEDVSDIGPLDVDDGDIAADSALQQLISDGKADGALGYHAVAQLVVNAGVPCIGDRVALATAIAYAESNFRPTITNVVGNSHGTDRGLWQINSYWHPEVSIACALNAACNARAMATISKKSTKWSEWWTYNNHKQVPFMGLARVAQTAVCAEAAGSGSGSGSGSGAGSDVGSDSPQE